MANETQKLELEKGLLLSDRAGEVVMTLSSEEGTVLETRDKALRPDERTGLSRAASASSGFLAAIDGDWMMPVSQETDIWRRPGSPPSFIAAPAL